MIDFNFPYSSSFIRDRIRNDKLVNGNIISDNIKRYIYKNNLYMK